ncbi:calcium-binding modulator protein [Niveomyces insectorum RCEF 264]|uniref:Calcium-binding modulator protein n=1 Tax=Niveomyces insectorum RCEF 264 TaxID=1081102 RepID=A0A167PEC9_9HYPO|nr:calcium-binding modulator protein [Niveomyces insectorum RCEF 264]
MAAKQQLPPQPYQHSYQQSPPVPQKSFRPQPHPQYQQPPQQQPQYQYQSPPPQQPRYQQPPPQQQPQQYRRASPQLQQQQQQQQQQQWTHHDQQPSPRLQPEHQYQNSYQRPISPAAPPRDRFNGANGRVGLPEHPRDRAHVLPPPRSPIPPPSPAFPVNSTPPPVTQPSTVTATVRGKEPLTDEGVRALFAQFDTNNVGFLTEKQLGAKFVNSNQESFNAYTVSMMMRMFDSDRNGELEYNEFVGLWRFLEKWADIFDRFDADRSGSISLSEFKDALVSFQYRLSDSFIEFIFRVYDQDHKGVITFDIFMQSCITLKRMTDVFKKYDDDRDGVIVINFEDFVTEFLRQMQKMVSIDKKKGDHAES